ncbi:MAG: 50S ribosomal protein L11 methyltransferase [Flavobacteriales bacterium]
MGWHRIHVRCSPAEPGRDIATAWLDEAGCSMFQHEGDALMAFGQDHELDFSALEEVRARLEPLGLVTWQASEVEEQNWNAQWESDYPEVEVGDVVRVSAPFHNRSGADGFAHQITIQPRMAFGTGHHETTRGLLAEMAAVEWTGKTVLDMGCGSGVLGIYAAMRGAAEVVFVDIDPWSVRNTEENIGLNGLSSLGLEVREGGANTLTAADAARFDVVIANINRNILMEDMAAYAATMKPACTLMLSGFMQPDVPPLEAEAGQHGLRRTGLREEGEWRILSLRR